MAVQVVVALAILLAALGVLLLAGTMTQRRGPKTAGPSGTPVVASRQATEPGPPPPTVAAPVPDSPEVQVTRRRFLNRAWVLAISVFSVAFGGASLGFLWPNRIAGFGGIINAGAIPDIMQEIEFEGVYYNPEGRFYLVPYEPEDDSNPYVEAGVAKAGLLSLFQRCAHLGCRVPYCETSGWFECPCHGSQYNRAGEIQAGPAPHGLWRFRLELDGDQLMVDTSEPIANPARGDDTIDQPPEGEHCVASPE